jgi:AcrR family transcriptional regulator
VRTPVEPRTREVVIDLRDAPPDEPTEVRRLLDAALVVLERSRWEGLKVDRVLAEAGLSTRCFYRHFAGKDELLAVLLGEEVADVVAMAEQRAASCADPARQVVTWIETIVGVSRDPATADRTRCFLVMGSALGRVLPHEIDQVRRIMITSLAEIIERGRALGCFTSDDPERDASAIHALVLGSMLASVDTGVPPTATEAARFAVRALVASTGPPS